MTKIKVAFGGIMGAGKSSAAQYLAEKFGGKVISFADPIYSIMYHAQSVAGFAPEKDRGFLQTVGDWGRARDPDVWVKVILARSAELHSSVFIGDIRYENEFRALKREGWTCVKLVAEPLPGREGTGSATHSSETGLDGLSDSEWDYVLRNDRTDGFYRELDNKFPLRFGKILC